MSKTHWLVLPEDMTADELQEAWHAILDGYCERTSDGKVVFDEYVVQSAFELANPDRGEVANWKHAIDIIAWRMAIKQGNLDPKTPYERN